MHTRAHTRICENGLLRTECVSKRVVYVVFVSKEVCVCLCECCRERVKGEGEREREGRGAGLSSCALSIIHDLTIGKTEEGKVDRSEREDTTREG